MSEYRSFAVALVLGLTAGACAAPHQPPVVQTEAEAGGPLIDGCQNIAQDAVVDQFITASYLTTWGSAWKEGASAGVRAGTGANNRASRALRALLPAPTDHLGLPVHSAPVSPDPFCLKISGSADATRRKIDAAFQQIEALGYTARKVRSYPYTVTTALVANSHRAARWIDRFTATLWETAPDTHAVIVRRDIYIARDKSGYYEATSVGNNEAWILTRIRDG